MNVSEPRHSLGGLYRAWAKFLYVLVTLAKAGSFANTTKSATTGGLIVQSTSSRYIVAVMDVLG